MPDSDGVLYEERGFLGSPAGRTIAYECIVERVVFTGGDHPVEEIQASLTFFDESGDHIRLDDYWLHREVEGHQKFLDDLEAIEDKVRTFRLRLATIYAEHDAAKDTPEA